MSSRAETERFCRQYRQRLDARLLTWPAPQTLARIENQQRIWEAIDQSQRDALWPAYDVRLLKELLQRIEHAVRDDDDPDILDSFAECMVQLSTNSSLASQPAALPAMDASGAYIWAAYTLPSSALEYTPRTLEVLENPRVLSAAGYTGHRTWEAALFLATLIDSSPQMSLLVEDRHILELGAGTGLLSLTCAASGAARVSATDGDSGAVQRLHEAQQRNEAKGNIAKGLVDCDVLIWGNDGSSGSLPRADVILAADVTYDPSVMPELVETLASVLHQNDDSVAIVAATLRNAETLAVFERECSETGLCIERLSDDQLCLDSGLCIGGSVRADVSLQTGFFHQPATEIIIMKITLSNR